MQEQLNQSAAIDQPEVDPRDFSIQFIEGLLAKSNLANIQPGTDSEGD